MFEEDYRNVAKTLKVTGHAKKVGFVLGFWGQLRFLNVDLDILLWFRACMLPITFLILNRTSRL